MSRDREGVVFFFRFLLSRDREGAVLFFVSY
jgi:hypothetical protein